MLHSFLSYDDHFLYNRGAKPRSGVLNFFYQSGLSGRGDLNVKPKVHHIPIFDDVFLPLHAQLANLFRFLLTA